MFLSDRIDCLIEELWQLAMTMASLKYIAGMVSQDWEVTRAFIELDVDNKHLAEPHRPSQVDKTEADSDKCFATDNIIASKEASHDEETAIWTISLTENEEKEGDDISMVAHQLPSLDISAESSEIVASMATHHIACNDIIETQESISMISHQISDDSKPVKPELVDPVNDDEDATRIVLSMYAHETKSMKSVEESSDHQVSMVAHFQHRSEEELMEQEGLISSMICHQTGDLTDNHLDEQYEKVKSGKNEKLTSFTEDEPSMTTEILDLNKAEEKLLTITSSYSVPTKVKEVEKGHPEFFSSMASHQLSFIDTPLELSEIPVTMVTHCITKEQENVIEDQNEISMITHQTLDTYSHKEETVHMSTGAFNLDHKSPIYENEEEFSDQESFSADHHEEITEEDSFDHKDDIEEDSYEEELYQIKYETEFDNDDLKYFPSMVANQVPAMDVPLEEFETPVSMSAHLSLSYHTDDTIETPDNSSMLAHHITKEKGHLEQEGVDIDLETSAVDTELTIVPEDNLLYASSDIPVHNQECEEEQIAESFKTDLFSCQEPDVCPSCVTHQLSPLDILHDFSDMPVTMVSHNISRNIEMDFDFQSNISMIAHQTINNSIEVQNNSKEVYEIIQVENMEESNTNTDILFITSLCSHETLQSETSAESLDCPVSMVSHQSYIPDENTVDTVSMVCHQSTVDSSMEKDGNMETKYTTEVEAEQNTFVATMTAHQLPSADIPSEFCVTPVSMASHILMDPELMGETQDHKTMLSHHTKTSNNIEMEDYDESELFLKQERTSSPPIDNLFVSSELNQNPAVDIENPEEDTKENFYILGDSCIESSLDESLGEKDQIIKPSSTQYTDFQELQFTSSMVTHQLPHSDTPFEISQFLPSSASHGYFAIKQEEICLPSSMLTHQYFEQNSNKSSGMESIEEEKENEAENGHISSMASHQLPIYNSDEEFFITALSHSSPSNEILNFGNSGSEGSMLGHLANDKMAGEETKENNDHPIFNKAQAPISKSKFEPFEIKEYVPACNDSRKVNDDSKIIMDQAEITETNLNKKLVEERINSYTEGKIDEKNEDSFHNKRPVGRDYINENNDNNENVALKSPFTKRLTRIQNLQRLVEDEIEEFENKRKNNVKTIEDDVETTETHIVNNVKNVQFQSCIVTHQKLNAEYNEDDIYEALNEDSSHNSTGNESILSSRESLNSVICTTSDNFDFNDEKFLPNLDEKTEIYSDYENEEESIIQASCTLEDNNPVVITSSQLPSAELKTEEESPMHEEQLVKINTGEENCYEEGQCKQQTNDEFDELKIHLRKTPRRSSNATTKIRETELLNSFLNEECKDTMEKCKKKQQEKKRKKSITLATLNESVKKQTYKIRFKVSLNTDTSKSSVLQYLFGCFGGEKLFHQQN